MGHGCIHGRHMAKGQMSVSGQILEGVDTVNLHIFGRLVCADTFTQTYFYICCHQDGPETKVSFSIPAEELPFPFLCKFSTISSS